MRYIIWLFNFLKGKGLPFKNVFYGTKPILPSISTIGGGESQSKANLGATAGGLRGTAR
jgi:hypothetical protein